jgi:hypothetical protein
MRGMIYVVFYTLYHIARRLGYSLSGHFDTSHIYILVSLDMHKIMELMIISWWSFCLIVNESCLYESLAESCLVTVPQKPLAYQQNCRVSFHPLSESQRCIRGILL